MSPWTLRIFYDLEFSFGPKFTVRVVKAMYRRALG